MSTVTARRATTIQGIACPTPVSNHTYVQLGHGSGGKMSAELLRERFLPRFGSPFLAELGDGARIPVSGSEVVVSTDTFVVSPLRWDCRLPTRIDPGADLRWNIGCLGRNAEKTEDSDQ
jgi:hypothetical protein